MVKHGMNVRHKATQFLNPNQIPVIAFYAPLYALAKLVQWKWPITHGEDKYMIMLGGLHMEMASWNTFGDYLENSAWTTALVQAEVHLTASPIHFLSLFTSLGLDTLIRLLHWLCLYFKKKHLSTMVPMIAMMT